MNTESLHIVFAGGGTAGHLFPGLAVAAELAALANPPRITFAGLGKPIEKAFVSKAGFEFLALPAAPAPKGMRGVVRFLAANLNGYRIARRFLRCNQVNVVVGLGGYASVPICRAAISAGVPLVLLEQNAFPGKATRWLAPRADLVCTAFDESRPHLQSVGPVRLTGNPLRAGFRPRRSALETARRTASPRSWRHRLLVLGGSGGAHALNEFVPKALYKLRDRLDGWQIVHQTGSRDVAETKTLYRKLLLDAIVVPFVQNLPQVLRRSDLVVSRAGGTTLAELAATGVPAVLIPYPHAADDHQRRNAQVFVAAGAAQGIDQRELAGRLDDALVGELAPLLTNPLRRQQMSGAMLHLARPDAAWQVATMVFNLSCNTATRNVA